MVSHGTDQLIVQRLLTTKSLKDSRKAITVIWAVVLSVVALLFIQLQQSVVEIALGIASITYGGLLGTFLLGLFFKNVNQKSAMVGFSLGILSMVLIILIPKLSGNPPIVHWTWYVAIGSIVTIFSGLILQKYFDLQNLKAGSNNR